MTEAATNNSASMVGRTIAGKYTIRATIGSGGMGFVYRATQAPIEREVALKVLRLDLAHQDGIAERFTREARAASRIQHPNAITIYEFGEDDGILYLAMELLYGETLRQRLRREPRLEPEHALDIFEAMGGALAAAHRVGVVHRDLKPDNIFLAQFEGHGEVVKVLDFGLAKLLDRAADADGLLTDVNLRLGTPRYMAPEQALGLQPIDARCDVYALGLLLFEMLAGRAPFVGEDGMEVLAQRLRREAPRLSETAPERGYSPELDGLLSAMLQRDREHRPADANEVLTRLRELRKSGRIYLPREPMQPVPEGRMSGPNLPGRPRWTAAPGGYPVSSLGPARGAGLASAAGLLAEPRGDLDEFDKPTVVIPSSPEMTPSPPGADDFTPVAPQAHLPPAHLPLPVQRATMTSAPGASVRGGMPPLSRRLVIALVAMALGAPVVALCIRWYQGRAYRAEPMEPAPGQAAGAPAPQEPARVAASASPPVAEPRPPMGREASPRPGPSRPKLCYIRIESTPAGARVERDGQVIGTTPYVDSMPYSSTPVRYRVSAEGYEPFEKTVTPEHRRTLVVALRPVGTTGPSRLPGLPPRKDSRAKAGVEDRSTMVPF
ncbi:MAG: protein kinase [Myxococcales bacterium]|nr:protein kinase [Myxococcales bacterium]